MNMGEEGTRVCRQALINVATLKDSRILRKYLKLMNTTPQIGLFFRVNVLNDTSTLSACLTVGRVARRVIYSQFVLTDTVWPLLTLRFERLPEREKFLDTLLRVNESESLATAELMLAFPSITEDDHRNIMPRRLLKTAVEIVYNKYTLRREWFAAFTGLVRVGYVQIILSNLTQIHFIPGILFRYTICLRTKFNLLHGYNSRPEQAQLVIKFMDDLYNHIVHNTPFTPPESDDWLLILCTKWYRLVIKIKPCDRDSLHQDRRFETKRRQIPTELEVQVRDIQRDVCSQLESTSALATIYNAWTRHEPTPNNNDMDREETRFTDETDAAGAIDDIMQETEFVERLATIQDKLSEDPECIELQQEFNQEPVPDANEISDFMSGLFTENEQTSSGDDVYLGDQDLRDIAGLVQEVDTEMDDIECYAMEIENGPFVPLPYNK